MRSAKSRRWAAKVPVASETRRCDSDAVVRGGRSRSHSQFSDLPASFRRETVSSEVRI
jgi:hypothetical protein